MKKAIFLACVVALVVSTAAATIASESYWTMVFKAGAYDGSVMSSVGTYTYPGAAPDPYSNGATFAPGRANLAIRDGATYCYIYRLDSDNPLPYNYNLALAVGSGFPSSMVYITAWSPDKYLGITGRSIPGGYFINVKQGESVLASWRGSDMYRANDPLGGDPGTVGFWYPVQQYADSWAASRDEFVIEVLAPELGSFVMLGSGLLGLAGLALRKRRA